MKEVQQQLMVQPYEHPQQNKPAVQALKVEVAGPTASPESTTSQVEALPTAITSKKLSTSYDPKSPTLPQAQASKPNNQSKNSMARLNLKLKTQINYIIYDYSSWKN